MPRKRYTPEEVLKLLRLVEVEVGQGKTTRAMGLTLGVEDGVYTYDPGP